VSDRRDELLAEGFSHVDTRAVALPHYVWKVDIEIEMDRELRLLEETVLGLVAAGIGDPDVIGKLVGDPVIAGPAIVDLLRMGAIGRREDRLQVNPSGVEMLRRTVTRETHNHEDVVLRHDPYNDELRWEFDEFELKENDRAASGLRALPLVPELERAALEARHEEIQRLVARDGLPFDREDLRARRREVVRFVAKRCFVAYREVHLELWHRDEKDEWRWRLLRGGGEDRVVSERLEQLEQTKDAVVIPLEEAPPAPERAEAQEIASAVSEVATGGRAKVLAAHEHRPALRDALREARRELIIISPWLATAAVDGELLGWIDQALRAQKSLRIRIGYGIEPVGKAKRPARDQEDALRRIHKIAERSRGRLVLVEIGNTHEKIVICDESYAIVTSFNFLSFKPRPGRGVRLETGMVIEDPAAVRELRRRVSSAMDRPAAR
jgi:hypothetical protein